MICKHSFLSTTPFSSLFTCQIKQASFFFGHVFSLSHQAFEQFVIHQLECPWENWFRNPDWVVPIKSAEAHYHSPVQAGEECRFELSVDSVATTSFALTTSLFQERHCCSVKTLHVFCHSQTKQKIPIPTHFLNRLQSFNKQIITT